MDQLRSCSTPTNLVRICSAICLFIGFTAAAILAVLGSLWSLPNEWWVKNHFIALWFALAMAFLALQALINAKPRTGRDQMLCTIFDYFFFVLTFISVTLSTVFWSLYGRIDVIPWGVMAMGFCILNVFLLLPRRSVAPSSRMVFKNRSKRAPINQASCGQSVLTTLNCVFKVIYVIIVTLMANGAIIHGVGQAKYGNHEQAKFLEIVTDGNRTQRIHYLCQGAKTEDPVLLFESSGSHGLQDWKGLLNVLDQRQQVCVWDKPGLGLSDYLTFGQSSSDDHFAAILAALRAAEPDFEPPFAMVGWGRGGEIVYKYALNHPQDVASLILVDVSRPEAELKAKQFAYGWTEHELENERQQVLARRSRMLSLINLFGVPFGLMGVFVGGVNAPERYWSDQDEAEQRWYFLTEKTWITQARLVQATRDTPPFDVFSSPIDKRIQVHVITTWHSEKQVHTLVCQIQKLTTEACEAETKITAYLQAGRADLVQNQGQVIKCQADECDLAFYVFDSPAYTISKIKHLLLKS